MSSNMSNIRRLHATGTLSSKIEFLDELNRSIQQLKQQLKTFRKRRDQVQAEIFTIRSANASVKRLPVELLSRIFEDCVLPATETPGAYKEASINLMKIQLVCKSWQSIAINTCTLWSHILVSLPFRDNLQYIVDWIKIQHRYLDLYLSRSRQASLKLFIDFDGMLDAAYIARIQLSHIIRGVFDDVVERNDWLLNIPWSSSPISESYLSLCVSLIQKVIGKDGQHMLRWSAMELLLPYDDDLAPRIRELFDHSAPQLKRLPVTGFEEYSKRQSKLYRSLISLPALSELTLSSSEFLNIVPPCPVLKKLQIDLYLDDFKSCPFHLINTFPLLDELSLISDGENVDEDFSLPIIHLPDLKVLKLSGPPPHNFVQTLRIKQLDRLAISQLTATAATTPIAHVCQVAKSLEWEYGYVDDYDYDYETNPLYDVLSTLFTQLQQAYTIAVPHVARQVTKKVVAECRARGQLGSLKSILTFETECEDSGYITGKPTPLITF